MGNKLCKNFFSQTRDLDSTKALARFFPVAPLHDFFCGCPQFLVCYPIHQARIEAITQCVSLNITLCRRELSREVR